MSKNANAKPRLPFQPLDLASGLAAAFASATGGSPPAAFSGLAAPSAWGVSVLSAGLDRSSLIVRQSLNSDGEPEGGRNLLHQGPPRCAGSKAIFVAGVWHR